MINHTMWTIGSVRNDCRPNFMETAKTAENTVHAPLNKVKWTLSRKNINEVENNCNAWRQTWVVRYSLTQGYPVSSWGPVVDHF